MARPPTAPPRLLVSPHPLARHKLAILRDKNTEPVRFRQVVTELAMMLTYEATADLLVTPHAVETPLASMRAHHLGETVGFVPVLRAGLGMVEGAWKLMPQAPVWHIGIRRDETSLEPVEYYRRLPPVPTVGICLVLDPMLATGGSAIAAVTVLKHWGAERVKFVGILAAPEGVAALGAAHPDVDIHVAAVDERLTTQADRVPPGFIWPGLGDAGDRQFDTGDIPAA